MDIDLKKVLDWLATVSNSAFAVGITAVLLFLWGIIPPSELVVTAYQFVAVSSPFIVGLTLIRWITKMPAPMTWLQAAYAVTAMCTWGYSWMMLIRLYMADSTPVLVIASALVVPIAPLTVLVVYLTVKAYKNNFEH